MANALKSRQIPDWGRLSPGDGDIVFREKVYRLTPREESSRRAYAQAINDAQRAFESATSPASSRRRRPPARRRAARTCAGLNGITSGVSRTLRLSLSRSARRTTRPRC